VTLSDPLFAEQRGGIKGGEFMRIQRVRGSGRARKWK
jgi:hypothetical protein